MPPPRRTRHPPRAERSPSAPAPSTAAPHPSCTHGRGNKRVSQAQGITRLASRGPNECLVVLVTSYFRYLASAPRVRWRARAGAVAEAPARAQPQTKPDINSHSGRKSRSHVTRLFPQTDWVASFNLGIVLVVRTRGVHPHCVIQPTCGGASCWVIVLIIHAGTKWDVCAACTWLGAGAWMRRTPATRPARPRPG